MAKKKNPEQENPAAEEQEVETPAEQEDTPEEETLDQEDQQETEGEDQEDPADEETEEDEEDPQDQQEDQQLSDSGQEPASGENAALKDQLLQAQGKLAAYAAGVAKGMIDDAVTLAMAEASKSGEVTEAAVAKAMEAVLKRHPEWKTEDESKKKTGGFKLGADRDSGGNYKKPAGNTTTNTKRWNRFK